MERAFIRFAGITAGVGTENFSTMPSYLYFGGTWAGFPNGVKELAYTATFSGGLSATLALESRGDFSFNTVTGLAAAPSAVPTSISTTYTNAPDTGYNLVGNVRADESWGWVQLSGSIGNNSVSSSSLTSTYNALAGPSAYGAYAIGFAFRYNLPFITPGDQVNFNFAYGHGDDGFVTNSGTSAISDSNNKRFLGGVERVDSNLVPTAVTSNGSVLSLGEEDAWSAFGIYTHYWAPH